MANLKVPLKEISVDTPKRDEFLQENIRHTPKEYILGRGSYGTVLKAVYKGEQVAVKVVNARKTSKIKTINSESNIIGWDHENIIKIFKIVKGIEYGIVIMERFQGQCLQHILDELPISLFHRICILLDISKAIRFCHQRKLVHADIKPQNVIVALDDENHSEVKSFKRNYKCKLIDFGSSFFEDSTERIKAGTIRYMSPEALRGGKVTRQTDIYSIGITMWQLRTGKFPYYSIEENDTIAYRVVKENLRPDCHLTPAKPLKRLVTPTKNKNCICKHFSTEVSQQCVEDIERFLASPAKKRVKLSSPAKVLAAKSISPIKLQPTAARGLKFSKIDSNKNLADKKPDILIRVSECSDDKENGLTPIINCNSLKSIFDSTRFTLEATLSITIENEYDRLYRMCWEQHPENRPTADSLTETVERILATVSGSKILF